MKKTNRVFLTRALSALALLLSALAEPLMAPTTTRPPARPAQANSPEPPAAVAPGHFHSHTCAIKSGALYCWGYNGDA
jgi:hypothetical protein